MPLCGINIQSRRGSDSNVGAEVVQEPMAEDYGVRDCAFMDPAGNLVRIQERR
jgi:hypothetical protein